MELKRCVEKALFGFIPADYPLGQGFKLDESTNGRPVCVAMLHPRKVSRMLCGAQQDTRPLLHGEAVVMWCW